MKTYLFDTFNRYKRFSEELDAKTILCNKSWWVFNDSGEKEVYIFNTDGTLIIAVSGMVTNATWQYITANKSLIISGNNQSYMVKPAFFDNQIFALQVDGTNDYAFLIDENNLPSTEIHSLADLKSYFVEKERQVELEEQRKLQAELSELVKKEIDADRKRRKSTNKINENDELHRLKELHNTLHYKADKTRVWFHRIVLSLIFIPWFLWGAFDISIYPEFITNFAKNIILNDSARYFHTKGDLWFSGYLLIELIIYIKLLMYITWDLSIILFYKRLVFKYAKENPTDLNAIQFLKKQDPDKYL